MVMPAIGSTSLARKAALTPASLPPMIRIRFKSITSFLFLQTKLEAGTDKWVGFCIFEI
jgi:hypothetical protein